MVTESISELRKICQSIDKDKLNLSPYTKLARKISIYITWVLLKTNITANQTTYLGMFICFVGCWFLFLGNPKNIFIGMVIVWIWYIFDHVDGEIARYRKMSSMSGIYLDYLSHYILHPSILFSLTMGLYHHQKNELLLLVGVMSAFSIMMIDLNVDLVNKAVFKKITTSVPNSLSEPSERNEEISVRETPTFMIKKIKRILPFIPFYVPNILVALFLFSLLDVLFLYLNVYGSQSYVSIVIILYGLITPPYWIFTSLYMIKTKETERRYHKYFNIQ